MGMMAGYCEPGGLLQAILGKKHAFGKVAKFVSSLEMHAPLAYHCPDDLWVMSGFSEPTD
jgi:hypothetical protein